jgi:Sec-independent protein translocase protein TatA
MFGVDTIIVLLVVLLVVLIWRGPKTLPKWGNVLGRGVKAAREEANDIRGPKDDEAPKG